MSSVGLWYVAPLLSTSVHVAPLAKTYRLNDVHWLDAGCTLFFSFFFFLFSFFFSGTCREHGVTEQFTQTQQEGFKRKEWFCQSHRYLAGSYYYCVDFFEADECTRQKAALVQILNKEIVRGVVGGAQGEVQKLEHWRDRKVVQRQINRLGERAAMLTGLCERERVERVRDAMLNPLCRCCGKDGCDGKCWGFWNTCTPKEKVVVNMQ